MHPPTPACLPAPPAPSAAAQHKLSRHIRLLICVTLYNEDQETLGKTLLGICEVPGWGRWGV